MESNLLKRITRERPLILCMLVFFIVMFCMGWLADDSYHVLRMADNFRKGYGLVYNPGERVSASTTPLLMLVVSLLSCLTRTLYWPMMIICLVCSSVAAYLVLKQSTTTMGMVIALAAMLACSCFMTFTTAGMENAMLFMLFGMLLIQFFRKELYGGRDLFFLSLTSSIIMLGRMDNALLLAPLLLVGLLRREKRIGFFKAVGLYVLGMLPFVIWELFSLLYYGVLFPNTAYAKLSTGFPLGDYLWHGVHYVVVSALYDPILFVLPGLYAVMSIRRRDLRHIMVCAGIALYYLYVIYIGGDFMVGRHFTVPFYISLMGALTLVKEKGNVQEVPLKGKAALRPLVFLVAGTMLYTCVVVNTPLYGQIPSYARVQPTSEIANERAFYFPRTSIMSRWQLSTEDFSPQQVEMLWRLDEVQAAVDQDTYGDIISWAPGIIMTYSAQDKYINDVYALGDPLLARLPAVYSEGWRIGHTPRNVPDGYKESVQTGENMIRDPSLHAYYDVIRLLTRSKDLFSRERLETIVRFNLGQYDYLLDEYLVHIGG